MRKTIQLTVALFVATFLLMGLLACGGPYGEERWCYEIKDAFPERDVRWAGGRCWIDGEVKRL